MFRHRRVIFVTLGLVFVGSLSACSESAPTVPEPEVAVTPSFSMGGNAATTVQTTFTFPFPPPDRPPAPVSAPCLDLDEPLVISGIWTIRYREALTARGHLHITEHLDYSDVTITGGGLTWMPAPGAHEIIVLNLPETNTDRGESAFTVKHEFHARYLSQNDLPDLRLTHSIQQVLGPDGEFRRFEGIPPSFSAECIGGGA